MCFHEFIGYFNSPKYPTDRLVKNNFNNVLLQGDTMHLKALDHGLIVLDPRIEFFSIDNLPTVVSISCGKNMFSYEICRSVTSPIHANTAQKTVD